MPSGETRKGVASIIRELWLYCTVTVGAVTPPPERGTTRGGNQRGERDADPRGERPRNLVLNSGPGPARPGPGPAPRGRSAPDAAPSAGCRAGSGPGALRPPLPSREGAIPRAGDVPQVSEEGGWQLPGGRRRPESRELGGGGASREGGIEAKCTGLCGNPRLRAWFLGAPRRAGGEGEGKWGCIEGGGAWGDGGASRAKFAAGYWGRSCPPGPIRCCVHTLELAGLSSMGDGGGG